MKFSIVLPIAVAAFANQAVAEPLRQPYKLNNARMSVRSLFGLQSRQDGGAYNPDQQFCGKGDTCAEACGDGFKQCPSHDGNTHCFHEAAKQTCCFNLSGEACDEGFYCAADDKAATWCCPNELGLEECASRFNLDTLSTQTPSPTKTSSVKPTSTAKPTAETTSTGASPSVTATSATPTTTSPDEPSATESITGKSSTLVNVETSSSSTFSSSSPTPTSIPTATRIESATSAVESTDAPIETESAPADCTTYTTALVVTLTPSLVPSSVPSSVPSLVPSLVPSSAPSSVPVVAINSTSPVANSTIISPGTSATPPPNPIKVSAANGRGAVWGTLLFGVGAVAAALL